MFTNDDILSWLSIDLEKFAAAPQSKYIVRLLVVLNDLESLSALSSLLTERRDTYDAFLHLKSADGISLFLLRQNASVMFETLQVLSEMDDLVTRASTPKTVTIPMKELWHFIASDNALRSTLSILASTTQSIDFADFYRGLAAVRNKLGAHCDTDFLCRYMKMTAQLSDVNHGLLAVNKEDEQFGSFRAQFVDDIMALAWQKAGMQLPSSTDSLNQLTEMEITTKYVKIFSKLKTDVSDFAYLLFEKYIEHYDLTTNEADRRDIAKQLEDYKK